MTASYLLFAGIDYGSDFHQFCLIDTEGKKLAEFRFEHSAIGISKLVKTLLQHGEPSRSSRQSAPCSAASILPPTARALSGSR